MVNIGAIGGTNLLSEIKAAIRDDGLQARLAVIIDIHRPYEPARLAAPHYVLNFHTHRDPDERNLARLEVLRQHEVDLILLGRYPLEKLGPRFMDAYSGRIIQYRFTLHPEEGTEVSGPHVVFPGGRRVTGTSTDIVCIHRDGERLLERHPLPVRDGADAHGLCDMGVKLGPHFFISTLKKIAAGEIRLRPGFPALTHQPER